MSDTATATVEVLTAEVRVLMVGSRQVTLSVVRQLDEVDPEEIRPFGRVRTARQPAAGDIEVVGERNGMLAYAVANLTVYTCTPRAGACRCIEHHNALVEQELPPQATKPKNSGRWHWKPETSALWTSVYNGFIWDDHHWSVYYPSQETYEKWSALPLIVLAGLR